jgi:hypothetical protein
VGGVRLVLVIEARLQQMADDAACPRTSGTLRMGLLAAVIGVAVVWLVRG